MQCRPIGQEGPKDSTQLRAVEPLPELPPTIEVGGLELRPIAFEWPQAGEWVSREPDLRTMAELPEVERSDKSSVTMEFGPSPSPGSIEVFTYAAEASAVPSQLDANQDSNLECEADSSDREAPPRKFSIDVSAGPHIIVIQALYATELPGPNLPAASWSVRVSG